MSHKETDRAVQKGVLALKALLTDRNPCVRVTGSEAAFTILATFWNFLPAADMCALCQSLSGRTTNGASVRYGSQSKDVPSAQKYLEMESLLHHMYGPVLWRAIKAANPRVRMNAAAILASTFPLKGSSVSHKETDRAVQKGVLALKALLTNRDPCVRVAGSEAAATILATFWNFLPTFIYR